MAEFRDKDWDRRYEHFKLLKEKRRQMELAKSDAPVSEGQRGGMINRDIKWTSQKEKRIILNRGQSRYLREHSTKVQNNEAVQSRENVVQSIVQDNQKSNENRVISDINIEKQGFSMVDMLPYIFIVIGVIIIVLILMKVV